MQSSPAEVRVLLVDDDPDLAALTAASLERADDRFSVETETSVDAGLSRLETADLDCIVSDYDMPGLTGVEFLDRVRADYPDLPFILFTGKGSEVVASEAISAGVTDYLQKETGTSQYTVLANRIANAVTQYRSTRALEASQERLSMFFEQSPLGVIEWDEDFRVVRINDAAADILGYSEADLVGRSWETLIADADRDRLTTVVEALLSDEGGYNRVEEAVTKDGETIVCEWHNRVVTDDAGDVVAIFSQFQDITDRRAQRRELEQTNAVLSTLFDTLPVGVIAEDASRNVLMVNQRLFELFDMPGTPSEVVGADCERLAAQVGDMFEEPATFVERTNARVEEQRPVDGEEFTLADGGTLARSYRPIELPDGAGHLWVYRDRTEQASREDRLQALNEVTRDLLTAESPEGVAELGVSAARDILDLEANAIHLYDDDRDALVPVAETDRVATLVGPAPTFSSDDSIAWRAFQDGESLALDDIRDHPAVHNPETPIRSELHLPLGDYGILLAGSPTPAAFDQEDLVLGEILAGNVATALNQLDRTEQLRLREDELSRQNDRLEEFASVVSHDLRNPLNVASGHLDLLAEEFESDRVDDIRQAHERMSTLIDDLLALAREGDRASHPEPVALDTTARACWHNVATAEATLVTDTDRTISADRSRLQQLLENLFRNAVEHGGEDVTIRLGDLPDGFYVADDGPGIDPDVRDSVFAVGYSTAERGSGFGLSIVEEVVDTHGWDIDVTASAEGGTRFEITGVARPED